MKRTAMIGAAGLAVLARTMFGPGYTESAQASMFDDSNMCREDGSKCDNGQQCCSEVCESGGNHGHNHSHCS